MYLPSVFGRAKCDRAARVAAARRGRCRARRAWRRRNGRADARVARRRARLYVTSVSKLRVKAHDAARDVWWAPLPAGLTSTPPWQLYGGGRAQA